MAASRNNDAQGKGLDDRNRSIRSSEKSTEKLSSTCARFEEHKRLWLARWEASSGNFTRFRKRMNNRNHLSSECEYEEQNSTSSTSNKQETDIVSKPTNTVSSESDKLSTSSNKHLEPLQMSPRLSKQEQRKSRIPIRVPGSTSSHSLSSAIIKREIRPGNKVSKIPRLATARHFPSSKQNEVIANLPQITKKHEGRKSLDNMINPGDDKKSLVVSDLISDETTANDIRADDLPLKTHRTDVVNLEAIQLNAIVSFPIIYDNISLFSTQNCHYNENITETETNANGIKHETNTLDTTHNMLAQHEQYDTCNDDIFAKVKKEQAELKAYYDSFPNINDAVDEAGPSIEAAKEFTKSILGKLPSGDVNKTDTLYHVLNNLYRTEDQECLFYDSENGIHLYDASLQLVDVDAQDRPFVLKLSSSEGLGNRHHVQTEEDDWKLIQMLSSLIKQNISDPVIEDIVERLSKAHGVDKENIVIKNFFVGTCNIVYTIVNLGSEIIKSLTEVYPKLKQQFKQFLSAKIHPLLFRPSFDIRYFDHRGNKSFPSSSQTHEIGPPGRLKPYITPCGWTRYGLNVLDKYANEEWLHPFKHPRNWYRAFHGTGRAQSEDFGDNKQFSDDNYAGVDALASIYSNEFCKARACAYGEGVYCSPNPKFPENGYVKSVTINTEQGRKSFKCMLQVAVNPDGVTVTKNKDIWVVPEPKDIRPYGILIKEA